MCAAPPSTRLSDDASDELAAALAERENRSDILAGLALEDQPDDVADILFDLARRETQEPLRSASPRRWSTTCAARSR